jgi:hypothetical protein
MNKFKLLFDILLVKYDIFNEYSSFDEVKRVLEVYLINYIDIPKKLIAGRLTPLLSIDSASANVAQSSNKKRKRGK